MMLGDFRENVLLAFAFSLNGCGDEMIGFRVPVFLIHFGWKSIGEERKGEI
jgi:hypothetical protein